MQSLKKIIDANPIYAPFYTKEIKSAIKDIENLEKIGTVVDTGQPKKVIGKPKTENKGGIKGPAKFEITGSRADIMPLHEAFMSYTYHAYAAAEKNLAKLRVYDEIDDAITKGVFAKNEIIKPFG